MPGYRSLPNRFDGLAAEQARIAEVLQRAGANEEAAQLLEAAIDVCAAQSPELPGWLCGRLAALYRTLRRHDDEVRLLMRYRDSQTSEETRTRFDARLSKAQAIAERKSRTDTRMLASVRSALSRRSSGMLSPLATSDDELGFDDYVLRALRDSFIAAAVHGDHLGLTAALLRLRRDARQNDYPPEQMIAALKHAWRGTALPTTVTFEAWNALYRETLTHSLALYFDEEGSP